jgi:GWxTD domain-containing protein
MRRFFMLLGTALLASQFLLAQQMEKPRGDQQQPPGMLFYEAVTRASDDSTLSRVDIPYRIDHEVFIPVKNNDTSVHWPFVRRGEVAIDLIDSVGVSRARSISEVVVGQNSSERSLERKEWYQGVSSFLVPPGTYIIQLELTDLESQRNFVEKREKVRAQAFSPSRFGISTPIFVEGDAGSRFPDTLTAQNFGGDLSFGSPGSLFFEVNGATGQDEAIKVSWAINQVGKNKEEKKGVSRDSSARILTFPHARIDTIYQESGIRYLLRQDSASHITGVLMPLPAEELPLRMYTLDLKVTAGAREEQSTITFRTVWPNMPFSLRDVDLALDALRFIVTPEQLDSLKDGSFEERRDHLENFWKLRDKTPGTAKNELMAEYYRRVDHAVRSFGTLRVPDGSRTDRGRIYVLYGPPTRMDRTLDPVAGFQETWIYEKLGKKFVFKDQSKSGNYVLSSSNGQ